jgi:hypothetical protein
VTACPIFANRKAAWLQSSSQPPQGEAVIVETKINFATERKRQSRSQASARGALLNAETSTCSIARPTIAALTNTVQPPSRSRLQAIRRKVGTRSRRSQPDFSIGCARGLQLQRRSSPPRLDFARFGSVQSSDANAVEKRYIENIGLQKCCCCLTIPGIDIRQFFSADSKRSKLPITTNSALGDDRRTSK